LRIVTDRKSNNKVAKLLAHIINLEIVQRLTLYERAISPSVSFPALMRLSVM